MPFWPICARTGALFDGSLTICLLVPFRRSIGLGPNILDNCMVRKWTGHMPVFPSFSLRYKIASHFSPSHAEPRDFSAATFRAIITQKVSSELRFCNVQSVIRRYQTNCSRFFGATGHCWYMSNEAKCAWTVSIFPSGDGVGPPRTAVEC